MEFCEIRKRFLKETGVCVDGVAKKGMGKRGSMNGICIHYANECGLRGFRIPLITSVMITIYLLLCSLPHWISSCRYDCPECSPITAYDPDLTSASEFSFVKSLQVPDAYKNEATDAFFVFPYFSYNICNPYILCPASANALWIRFFVVAGNGEKLLGDIHTNNPSEIEHQPNLSELLGIHCNKSDAKWYNFGEPIKYVGCMIGNKL